MNTLPDNYTIEDLQHYVCSINSYLGLMKHCDSYDIRKSIVLEMDLRFYKHLYIKGHYECVPLLSINSRGDEGSVNFSMSVITLFILKHRSFQLLYYTIKFSKIYLFNNLLI